MQTPRCIFSVAALTLALGTEALAQTIVNTGDDLAAIVAVALDGDVLEIHSNSTFVGTLTWTAKGLTIQAGAGFTPTIKGSPSSVVADLPWASPPTKAIFKNLALERGSAGIDPLSGTIFTPAAFAFQQQPSSPIFGELTLESCTVLGDMAWIGGGLGNFVGIFKDTNFEDNLRIKGTGSIIQAFSLSDCEVLGLLSVSTNGLSQTAIEIKRSRIAAGIELGALAWGTVLATVESTLLEGTNSTGFGVQILKNTTATFTNVTVTGFGTGLLGNPNVQWHNMLVYGNTTDLTSVALTEISNSLIADGTYEGLNGNFAGSVALDANGNLLSCSAGIDAANNSAPNLGATDLNGAPRIQDNDGDGTATVNVGATESTGSIPGSALVTNGTGLNPLDLSALNLPTAGANFDTQIATPAGTVLTAVAYDTAAPSPFALPGLVGELLIGLTTSLYIDYASGLHSQPIPADCALVGATTRAQGFRAEVVGPGIVVYCLNGLDLVIGG